MNDELQIKLNSLNEQINTLNDSHDELTDADTPELHDTLSNAITALEIALDYCADTTR